MGTRIDDSDTLAAGFPAGARRGEPCLAVHVERASAPPEQAILVAALAARPYAGGAYLPLCEVLLKAHRALGGVGRVNRGAVAGLARPETIAAVVLQPFALHDVGSCVAIHHRPVQREYTKSKAEPTLRHGEGQGYQTDVTPKDNPRRSGASPSCSKEVPDRR